VTQPGGTSPVPADASAIETGNRRQMAGAANESTTHPNQPAKEFER